MSSTEKKTNKRVGRMVIAALSAVTMSFGAITVVPQTIGVASAALPSQQFAPVPEGAEESAIDSSGDTQAKPVAGRVFVNFSERQGYRWDEEDIPVGGLPVYAYWTEDGYRSPVYTAVTAADGTYRIPMSDFTAFDGTTHVFEADGAEFIKVWTNTVGTEWLPAYNDSQGRLQSRIANRQFSQWLPAGDNGQVRRYNMAVERKPLGLQKDRDQWDDSGDSGEAVPLAIRNIRGRVQGEVFWNLKDATGLGPVNGPDFPKRSRTRDPWATGVTIVASYLNDTGKELMDAWKAAHPDASEIDITNEVTRLVTERPALIAETATGTVQENGEYSIQFKGLINGQKDVVDTNGTIGTSEGKGWETGRGSRKTELKHINRDYLYIAPDIDDSLSTYGYFPLGYRDASGVLGLDTHTPYSVGSADFALGRGKATFNVKEYDSISNPAPGGTTVQTETNGYPPVENLTYVIKWYKTTFNDDGTRGTTEEVTGARCENLVPDAAAHLPSCPITVPDDLENTTLYEAKVFETGAEDDGPLGVDSFVSLAKQTNTPVGVIGDDGSYSGSVTQSVPDDASVSYQLAEGEQLPDGLQLDENGNITGKPAPGSAGYTDALVVATITYADGRTEDKEIPTRILVVDTAAPADDSLVDKGLKQGEQAVKDEPYSQPLTVAGVDARTKATQFTIPEGGNLPEGMSLSDDGTLSGTPTEAGTHTFPVSYQVTGPDGINYPVTDTITFVVGEGDSDRDGDGIPDSRDPDADGDGVNNADEKIVGTDPLNPTTDGVTNDGDLD
ncbi:putative Ig domain-containing protein, partial [Corynebacterium sp. CCM 8862]